MKTWEMIKELTENPSKEFVAIPKIKHEGRVRVTIEHNKIFFRNSVGYSTSLYYTDLNWKWEEVNTPVSFMEAFKAWDEGNKTIICKVDKDSTVTYEGNRTNFSFHADCIKSNEWYIEEEN